MHLRVLEIEAGIREAMERGDRLVVSAPTGSGKTTQVPQILDRCEAVRGEVVVLQPRRLATRMVAGRVADEMGCRLGGVAGYETRHERRVSNETRIRFMTEGVLLAKMGNGDELKGVGAVVLDEFHGRTLAGDLLLGLIRRMQENRSGLKLVVMSATLDAEGVGRFLGCEVLEAGGRMFEVEMRYMPKRRAGEVWDWATDAVGEYVRDGGAGDVLVFMPGVYEIGRTVRVCRRVLGRDIEVLPLHGGLSGVEQDAVVRGVGGNRQRVIVATNVAETSITIEGVRCVVDSGLARVHRYDGARGMNVLKVEGISLASAEQRKGRAGRVAEGVCYRLWVKGDDAVRCEREEPEIRRIELSEGLLKLKGMGVGGFEEIELLDRPREEDVAAAEGLLVSLALVDDGGGLTEMGRMVGCFGGHPRVGRVLVEASKRKCLDRGLIWAGLISERDILRRDAEASVLRQYGDAEWVDSDLALREHLWETARTGDGGFDRGVCEKLGLDVRACGEVGRVVGQYGKWCRRVGLKMGGGNRTVDVVKSVLAGYGDHVGMHWEEGGSGCLMAGRKGVALDGQCVVRGVGPVVAIALSEVGRGDRARAVLRGVNRVEVEWLKEMGWKDIGMEKIEGWDEEQRAVREMEEVKYGELVVGRVSRPGEDGAKSGEVIVEKMLDGELRLKRWDEEVEQWIERVRCVGEWYEDRGLIRYERDEVAVLLHEIVGGASRFGAVEGREVLSVVKGALDWDDQVFVEKMAPRVVKLKSGYGMKVWYECGEKPRGRAKIQDFYGMEEGVRVGGGRVGVVLEILGPNFRPVQVTEDLKGFWTGLYPELKKELKRRYPKHEWR